MNTETRFEAHFSISGNINLEEITELLGIQPTRASLKGSARPDKGIPLESGWILSSGPSFDEDSLESSNIVENLIDKISDKSSAINKICEKAGCYPCLAVWMQLSSNEDAFNPKLVLRPESVIFLGAIKASIDIDVIVKRGLKRR
jgi:hypothetical protein